MLNAKTSLGIDISANDIKIVELRKSRDKYTVVQATRLKTGDDITDTLKRFIFETNTYPSRSVWSLPTNACSVKFAELPKTSASETARMARYEAESQIPLPLADLVWGWTADKPTRGEVLSHVLIAGARRSVVEETVLALEPTGLPLSGAMVASLAGVRSLRRDLRQYSEPVFVVDVGEEWTDLTMVSGGQIMTCRSIRVGINELVCAASADMGMTLQDAREWVTERSVFGSAESASDSAEERAVQGWTDALSLEIRRSVLSAVAAVHGNPVKKVILTGDGAVVPGLREALVARTNVSIEIGDPWSGMSLTTVAAHNSQDDPAAFAVATGLALCGLDRGNFINLMPREREEEQIRRRKEMTLLSALGLAAVALLIVLLAGHSGVRDKTIELSNLKSMMSRAKSQAGMVQPGLTGTASAMETMVSELQGRKDSPLEILESVSSGFPKSCWLTEFRYDSGKSVVLRGDALSNSAVADAVYMLYGSGQFESVSPDYSNLGQDANAAIYDFQIKCTLPPSALLVQTSSKVKGTTERVVSR